MNVFELFAKIGLDTKEYEKGLKDVESKTKAAGNVLNSVFSSISNGFKILGNGLTSIPGKLSSIGSTIASFGSKAVSVFTTLGKEIASIPKLIDNVGQTVSKAGSQVQSFGKTLTSHITTPAIAAGTALAGITLAKGWSRLTQIDEAKAKLRGLGNDAESVTKIMESALASVKGTAYGMDEAATTAASAVAAGIKQGEELTQYLTTVGDAAAIAGTSMGDMGSIFNKVVTAGKAQNDVLSQLADKGIPIYQWLAEETDHAADEIFEMAKKGEVDTATFLNAVKNHVGGAAKELGNATITGAMANVWAAVSRIGANFLGAADDAESFAGKILPLIIKLQDALGVLEDKAKEYGKVFAEVFQGLVNYFTEGNAHVEEMGETAQRIWGVIQPILDKVTAAVKFFMELPPELQKGLAILALSIGPVLEYGGQAMQILGFLISNGGILIAGLGVLGGVLAYVAASGQDTTGVFQFLADGMLNLVNILSDFADKLESLDWTEIGNTIADGIKSIFDMEGRFGDFIGAGIRIVEALLEGISEAAPAIISAIALVLSETIDYISVHLSEFLDTGIKLINSINQGISDALPILYESAKTLITTFMQYVNEHKEDLIATAETIVSSISTFIIDKIPLLVDTAIQIVKGIGDYIIEHAGDISDAAKQVLTTFGQSLTDHRDDFEKGAENLKDIFLNLMKKAADELSSFDWKGTAEKISEFLSTEVADATYDFTIAGANILGALVSGIILAAPDIVIGVTHVIEKFTEAVKEKFREVNENGEELCKQIAAGIIAATPHVLSAVASLIEALLEGLFVGIGLLIGTLGELLNSLGEYLIQCFKDVFGINSPSTVMMEIGEYIMQGLLEGLESLRDSVVGFFSDIADDITNTISDLIDRALDWGRDLIDNFKEGLANNPITGAISGIAEEIEEHLGFSEPEEGPLSNFHTYAPDMMKLFAQGIKDNTDLVTDQLKKSFDFDGILDDQRLSFGTDINTNLASGSSTVNGGMVQNLVINAPTEQDPSEIARQTRNANREFMLQLRMA